MGKPKILSDIDTLYLENDTQDSEISRLNLQNDTQDTEIQNKPSKSIKVVLTLTASSWNGDTYTISNSNITATNVVELYPTSSITQEQLEALQEANIIGGTQSKGTFSLVAKGDVPTVDIPVTLIVRGDM